MQRIHRVAREALEQALFDHHACTAAAFFGRLEDEVHRAVEASRACQLACRTEQHGGVAVVAAAVVHTGDPARIAEARLLAHRQRIHVSVHGPAITLAQALQAA